VIAKRQRAKTDSERHHQDRLQVIHRFGDANCMSIIFFYCASVTVAISPNVGRL